MKCLIMLTGNLMFMNAACFIVNFPDNYLSLTPKTGMQGDRKAKK